MVREKRSVNRGFRMKPSVLRKLKLLAIYEAEIENEKPSTNTVMENLIEAAFENMKKKENKKNAS